MINKKSLALSIAVTASSFVANAAASDSGREYKYGIPERTEVTPYCVMDLSGTGQIVRSPKLRCYETVAEVVADESDGTILLPVDTSLKDLARYDKEGMFEGRLGASYTLSKQWDYGGGYSGSYLSITNSEPCSAGGSKYIANVGATWNDRISFVGNYNGCTNINYEHASFKGRTEFCWPSSSCSLSGKYLDNKTTSIKIFPQ